MVNRDKPTIDHLQVFGCGAYVFIPAEVRKDKLVPKSEAMVYLGTHPGGKGWIFMRRPNNTIFSAAQATFDESVFPKCPQASVRRNTRLQTPAPTPSHCSKDNDCQCPLPGLQDDDEQPEHCQPASQKGKQRATEPEVQIPAPQEPPRSAAPLPAPAQPSQPEP